MRVAGKTGTTQSYRDAWFCGFTGNYTAAVWLGNDDFSPTRNMTGGSLPAMTWQRLMAYANQNIELKPIPGIKDPVRRRQDSSSASDDRRRPAAAARPQRPQVLMPQVSHVPEETCRKTFHNAPHLQLPTKPETLSSL